MRPDSDRLRAELTAHPHADDFLDWIEANPEVLESSLRITRWAKRQGIKRLSGAYVRERVRHEALDVQYSNGFKFDNDFTPLLTRLIAILEPDLADIFTFTALATGEPS